jgi:hypothetical protein
MSHDPITNALADLLSVSLTKETLNAHDNYQLACELRQNLGGLTNIVYYGHYNRIMDFISSELAQANQTASEESNAKPS